MGPVLEAIDAEHYERTPEKGKKPHCHTCKTVWPCDEMKKARKRQSHYAEDLRLQSLITRETRRTYV